MALRAGIRGNPIATAAGREVECSLSRSQPYSAAACLEPGEGGWIGIDVESLQAFESSGTDSEAFARTVLGPQEITWWRAFRTCPEGRAPAQILLRAWVRKEAVLTSMHSGFRVFDPRQVELSAPWLPARCLSHPWIDVVDCETPQGALASLAYNPTETMM